MSRSTLLVLLAAACAACVLAAVPADLSNFQNEYVCDQSTLIVRPRTVSDVQEAVKNYAYIRTNGRGHSWNKPFFCANASYPSPGNGPAVNIQTATLRPLTITVLEEEQAVWVDAGVTTIHLIEYLADYVTEKSPTGYTLGAFPWYVYQTVGGAVATGTHGSSLEYKSMSNQVLELEMVAANGTLLRLSPETHPFLMRAARVSVGRLGIITRLKFRIVKEQVVHRELRIMSVSQFLSVLDSAQKQYLATGAMPPELNETEWFWQTQRSEIYMVSFTRGDSDAVAGDAGAMAKLLAAWQPDASTTYNTSLSLLQGGVRWASAALQPVHNLLDQLPFSFLKTAALKAAPRLEDLTIINPVSYMPDGLHRTAHTQVQRLLQETINAPNPSYPRGNTSRVLTKRVNAKVVQAFADTRNGGGNDRTRGVTWPPPTPKPINFLYGQTGSANTLMDANRAGLMVIARNQTVEAHRAYLYQPSALEGQIKGVLYDQYEVAVPVSSMHECVQGMMKVMYGDDIDSLIASNRMTDKGFRSAPLMRLVGKEDGLLSLTGDEPRLFFNIEDYLYYNGGRKGSNVGFKKVIAHLRSSPACGKAGLTGSGGRMHWGKAGWADFGCFRGDVEYPDTWCDFGCAVQTLDPTGKFEGSAPDRWTWEGVNLAQCCSPNGFDKTKAGCTCTVKHARSVESCGPAPWYTYR